MTQAPARRHRSWVPSVLPESTTTISSQKDTLARHGPMRSASFMAMMHALTGVGEADTAA